MLAALGYGFEVLFHNVDCVVNLLYMGHKLVISFLDVLILAEMVLLVGDPRCPKTNFGWRIETPIKDRLGHKALHIDQ